MGDKKDKNKEDKDGDEGKFGRSSETLKKKMKKNDKNIKFRLPSIHTLSEESFASAQSHTSQSKGDDDDSKYDEDVDDDVDDDDDDDDDDHDHDLKRTQTSILQKFISSSLLHPEPRKVTKTATSQCRDLNYHDLLDVSSLQLFEIKKDSPTPSDANLALVRATYLRKLDAVKLAIGNGADVNILAEKQTPLLIATEIGDDRLVAYLLTIPDIKPDYRNEFGQTPLIIAVRNAFKEIVRLLLNHNADVNLSDNMGRTPLHIALFQKRANLVKLLLAYGADVEKPDCFGEKPIYTCAVKKPHMDCMMILLKMGADINTPNFSKIPLLSRTILNGTDFSIVEALVKHGASVNAQDLVSKKTPLHFAALLNNVKTIKFLVANGADVNIKTTYNFTPFDEALFQRSLEAADCLLTVMKSQEKETPQKQKNMFKKM